MPDGTPVPVFMNARAGTASTNAAALHEHFGDRVTISAIEPDRLRAAVAAAAAARQPIIGVAGGDGTLRTAVSALVGTDSALLCIPIGTLNTFARRHGIPDIAAAAAALHARRIDRIAVGMLQDGYFLNTLTFGEYARIVRTRERYRRFIGKWPGALIAIVGALATLRRITVRLDVEGSELIRRTPIVWVGVGWGSFPRLHESMERRSRPDLEVVVLRSQTKRAAAACLLRLARRMLREQTPLRDPQLEVLHARELTLDSAGIPAHTHRRRIDATADGEVLRLSGPVRIGVLDAGLSIIRGVEPASDGVVTAGTD